MTEFLGFCNDEIYKNIYKLQPYIYYNWFLRNYCREFPTYFNSVNKKIVNVLSVALQPCRKVRSWN